MAAQVPLDTHALPDEAAVRGVVDCVARYVAVVLSARCSLAIRHGGYESDIDVPAAPSAGTRTVVCASCGRLSGGALLCHRCRRRSPELVFGPRLIATMRRSANPDYAVTAEVKRRFETLHMVYDQILDALKLSEELERIARHVLQHAPAGATMDVPIPRVVTTDWDCYNHGIKYESQYRYEAGGLGIAMRDEINRRAHAWLLEVDRRICNLYDLCTTPPDRRLLNHLLRVVDCIALAIANQVAMTTPDTSARLGTGMCEELNAQQIARCRTVALLERKLDEGTMSDLYALANFGIAHEREKQIITDGVRRRRLSHAVTEPPPEFHHQLLSLDVTQMNLSLLQRALSQPGLDDHVRMSVVELWRQEDGVRQMVATAAGKALEMVRQWRFPSRSGQVCPVRRLAPEDQADPQLRVPRVTWCAPVAHWVFCRPTYFKRRRTGLDDIGLRTVMLVSLVWSYVGSADPAELSPGLIEAKLVRDCACVEAQRASACLIGLRDELKPLCASAELLGAQRVLMRMAPQVEEDLYDASCAISLCSEVQIMTVCHPNGPLYERTASLLTHAVQGLLPETRGYHTFLPTVLELVLPLIRTQRMSVGMSVPFWHCHPLGDLLRCVRTVREWDPRTSELVLSPRALKAFPRLRAGLDALAASRRVVRVARRQYVFSTPDVLTLLGPHR